MHNPKVSVLIPAYNYGLYLPEAIESVLNQTYTNFELIVVDNCSSDNTQEIVARYAENDSRVTFRQNSENIGMYRNYNQALLHANGEYIKFLNADDKFAPTLLEEFVKILDEHPSVSIVTSHRQYFQNGDNIIKTDFSGLQNGKDMILLALSKINFIGEPTTVMFRRNNLNLGLFDTSLIFFADLDMWLRHLSIGDLYIVDKVLSFVRKHNDQGTVTLREDSDKSVFIAFQWPEYVRNAILMNRFRYDLYDESKSTRKLILGKSAKVVHRLLFSNSKNNQRVRDYFSSVNPLLYLRYFVKNMFRPFK